MPPDDIPAQTAQIARLRSELDRRCDELATLQRMILALETDLAVTQGQLKAARQAGARAEARLKAITASLPWRISAPLRAVLRRLR